MLFVGIRFQNSFGHYPVIHLKLEVLPNMIMEQLLLMLLEVMLERFIHLTQEQAMMESQYFTTLKLNFIILQTQNQTKKI